ncbi:hypothetical protein HMPREF9569_00715 [Cutibacterium acnes HL078PA1]|nr:hypothetical protein HMPREF9593_02198 [Cutibacterium acnes HL046PA2]EFT53702.1 hypothetical protein HMPREF9569_00715 [Cutibacterium acnes HL078PA1]
MLWACAATSSTGLRTSRLRRTSHTAPSHCENRRDHTTSPREAHEVDIR